MNELSHRQDTPHRAAPEETKRYCKWLRQSIDPDRFDDYRDVCWNLLRALLTQCSADAEDGEDPKPVSTQELWRLACEERDDARPELGPDTARKRLNEHWPKLKESFEEYEGRFTDAGRKEGFTGLFWPVKDESRGGRQSTYRLEWRPFDASGEAPALPTEFAAQPFTLRYHEDKSSLRFSLLGRAFLAPLLFRRKNAAVLRIEGVRRFVPASALVVMALFIGLLAIVGLIDVPSGKLNVGVFIIAAAAWWTLMRPLIRLYDRRIIMASPMLYPIKERDCQIEVIWDPSTENRQPSRGYNLRLVRHAADCPLCGGRVWLADGGIEYISRLVGRCSEEPTEHVFSFDRKLRAGYWLRGSKQR